VSDSEIKGTRPTAGAAFKCIAVLIGTSLVLNALTRAAYEQTSVAVSGWLTAHSYGVNAFLKIVTAALWLMVAFAFSRCDSAREFICRVGLNRWPSLAGWLGSLFGFGIGAFSLFAITKGWMASNPHAENFYRAGGLIWALFAIYTGLLGPFCEETVVRGFLFEAFRGSYSFLVSTILVLGFQIYFHWRLIINDWLAGTLFILTAVLLCTMRERTRSLWNCFLLHSGYNATIIRQWPLWLAIVGVLLAVRLGSVKQPNLMEETKV